MTEKKQLGSIRGALLASGVVMAAWPALAADVTPDRLVNADKEPQNWLMNHRTYNGQRFSPLARINRENVKGLKLAYAVALAGGNGNEFIEATPLAEDGFLYITDSWGVLYKIDGRSGDFGRIVWRMDPKQQRQQANRGAALWGNLVISPANHPARIIATDKETGRVVWETNVTFGAAAMNSTGAPLAVKDKVIFGAAGSDSGWRGWIAALDAATGKRDWLTYTIPAPGEPGSETWKNNAWQTGGGAAWLTGTYDPQANQLIWGTGNPVPMMNAYARPGDNLYTNSVLSLDSDTGKMSWYFQFTPGDHWDYDEAHTHILIDAEINGEPRKLITHSARNGFTYTFERATGQILLAKPYMDNVNWTKGIDQKTGKPLDYDPTKDVQTYSGAAAPTPSEPVKRLCPNRMGGSNFWPTSYSPRTKLIYIPAMTACEDVTNNREFVEREKANGWFLRSGGGYRAPERYESNLTAVDPLTGEIRKNVHLSYPNFSGTLATGGGLIFLALLDGTVAAYDDTTLEELWKVNVGSGFSAPPITFEVNGRQYVAIASGLGAGAKIKLANSPEMRDQRNATVLYVFGL
ncbi:MAG TPA: PQQ-dependent dehydrogenase, methanol/ethanol family [Xanthobacteraceae bacterium]|jgi:alcohol dehydrogenase (cytochrome c)